MPAEVVLMMDLAGVLTTSPFPAARRLAENMMRCVFERAGSHMMEVVQNDRSAAFLARHYSNFFFTVTEFTQRTMGVKPALERLELGEIHRLEFVPLFRKEVDVMLEAVGKVQPEELECLGVVYPQRVQSLRKRFPELADPVIQILIRELLDPEAFLCTMEKVSPRKNVMNLLHYLRMSSQQEIRLYAMGNTWEAEGQYQRLVKALSTGVSDDVSPSFPVSCPVEYAGAGHHATFLVNGLFDGSVQSYTAHKRKPYPDIFMDALGEVMRDRTPSGDALRYGLKPYIFYFDDVAAFCEVASNLPGNPFSEVYCIKDGAVDVYNSILKALKLVAEKDTFWAQVVKGVEKDVAPLFKPPRTPEGRPISWVAEELHNYNHNLLFIPPPPCEWSTPVNPREKDRYRLDEEDQDALLYYCAQHLPHLFPLRIPEHAQRRMKLCTQPGLATSAGPITFEYMAGNRYFETYRITLRTGSYLLRIQPRGSTPYGSVDIRREFEVMDHLNEAAPGLPVPHMLLFCDSYAVCGRRFFLARYVDGELIRGITQLIQPRIRRPYSKQRMIVNVELRPVFFYKAAIEALATLHAAPLPRFMRQKEERQLRDHTAREHPLARRIRECVNRYDLAVEDSKTAPKTTHLRSTTMEALAKELGNCFDTTQLSRRLIPKPDRLVIVHGSFDLSAVLFSHRSLEGRPKYPPRLIGLSNFRFTRVDDPLLDVATLALFALISPPEGVLGLPRDVHTLFPTPEEILDMYCAVKGYMQHLDRATREDIFSVYLAALCLERATRTVTELSMVLKRHPSGLPHSDSRSIAFADQLARRGLELLMKRHGSRL